MWTEEVSKMIIILDIYDGVSHDSVPASCIGCRLLEKLLVYYNL